VKVVWTETAVAHLDTIYEFIAKTSPLYAHLMVRRLWDRTGQIEAFPESGRTVPEYHQQDVREFFESPYRIIYRVHENRVEILAVVHARRAGPGLEGEGRAT
jgi:toxin ParE1/3/4